MITIDTIGVLILIFCGGAVFAAWLIDRHHERTPLFLDGYGPEPEPREAAPLLPEMIAAPVAAPIALPDYVTAALGHQTSDEAVDSIFTRAMARQVAEQIRDGAS